MKLHTNNAFKLIIPKISLIYMFYLDGLSLHILIYKGGPNSKTYIRISFLLDGPNCIYFNF